MGKSQKKRSMRRHNPMRVPDSHLPKGLASASSTSSKTEAILPILQKMESPDASERKWACVAVSNLIQNDPSTRRLLQGKNIVGALITRLTDSEEEVIVEAAGSLRNLCIDGGYDICAEMYNKNILAPWKTFIPKISNTLSQYLEGSASTPENAQNIVYQFADNVITLLWCLSETSNKALNAINEIHLVPFLMSFLAARHKIPLAPVTAAAHCLYVLTDDNYPAIADVRADAGYISCLLEIARPGEATNGKAKEPSDPRSTTLKVLCAGILRNVSPLPPPAVASSVDIDRDIVLPLLQPVISCISLPDISKAVMDLVARQASGPQIEKLSLKHTPKSDHKSNEELELERLEANLRTVQLALEILTGACATLPDPENDVPEKGAENGSEDEDDEDLDVDESDADMKEDTPTAGAPSPSFLPTLVAPLLALIQPTSLSFPPLASPSVHPPTTSALSAVHISALECLNNLFLSLATSPYPGVSSDNEAGRKVWDEVWAALAAVGTETGPGQERRQGMWHLAVGVLWGVGNVWKGSLIPNEEQVKLLMQLCDATSDERIRVKCIGTLECLAQHPRSIDGNRLISQYLLSILPSNGSPSRAGTEPLIQAVSAIIDIYSDEGMPYDINFRQGGYLGILASGVDEVKKAVRGIDRRKEGGKDLRRRAEETGNFCFSQDSVSEAPSLHSFILPPYLTLLVRSHGGLERSPGQRLRTLYTYLPISMAGTKQIVSTADAVPPLPVFSQAVISRGRTVYVSGNVGCTKDYSLVEGGVQAQTRAALENIAVVLKAAGSGLEHIVKTNVYLTHLPRDFQAMNEIYVQFFDNDKLPARTCIGVSCLPLGADVEIECIAEILEP
ncbi:putative ARM repeat-containing protein [Lyophyllum shimeji]|uniref:ARM repeat-containing protein n=1 Tax=Lyophyllum shimeji TaxID=47721 RepID=A0A9P3PI39_LYOSH|nr:putative ARM repeat-containing protein [Lyophyllum shimeji]